MKNTIGVLIHCNQDTHIQREFQKAAEMDIFSCQLCVWDQNVIRSERAAKEIADASLEYGVDISLLWAGWSGPCEWNFTAGPSTIGLVPPAYRFQRLQELIGFCRMARRGPGCHARRFSAGKSRRQRIQRNGFRPAQSLPLHEVQGAVFPV